MTAAEIRQAFLDFWESKGHKIVASAPIVIKDDPTLMFTNAGMNQFKDLFLGNKAAEYTRLADTQKCLRVSGKHNDLEEVGVDTYHHTMFEMLGNWSIGDYFKAEALEWSWELLTKVYKLDPSRLYVTVFEGDEKEGLPSSTLALAKWKELVPEDQILYGNKKDNFWEMGETGPCGPCSEIHFDNRSDEERAKVSGRDLVNQDDPQVIEIWNNVFIQYNRKADRSLEELPAKHVDTGMGYERLVRVIQGKSSNYDTDVFTGTINEISKITGKPYEFSDSKKDVAFRVIADHVRAISFTIADGQLPSNGGAGYVIRRILRRAVRYYYSYLDTKKPLIHLLVPVLANQFKNVFPELQAQVGFVSKVVLEEEKSFLKTLEGGLKRFDDITVTNNVISGKSAFELYDTYGFPYDLTALIASEKGMTIDEAGFQASLQEQKARSKADAKKETGDWITVNNTDTFDFLGYDADQITSAAIVKYRVMKQKDQVIYQVALSQTPFYAEGGGQVGDTGYLIIDGEYISVLDTKKEDGLAIHYLDRLPDTFGNEITAEINVERRRKIEKNHSATHLLHAALRQVLGSHVQQKGSLVRDDYFRFDFAHFQKVTDDEIAQVETIVNKKIRKSIELIEARSVDIETAKTSGAMMLFGEKYGDKVRMITFDKDYSIELCGGCHVKNTGSIGLFKITSEGAIAAGVRRIEAVTAEGAESYINGKIEELDNIKALMKSPNVVKAIGDLQDQNKAMKKEIESLQAEKTNHKQKDLFASASDINGIKVIKAHITDIDSKNCKNLAYNLLASLQSGVVIFGIEEGDKAQIMVAISEDLTKEKNLHAGNMVKALATHIDGGGGGQAFFATAGGKNPSGIGKALEEVIKLF